MANYPMKTRKSSKFREREDEKKELQDLADTPPSMLSEGERFRLFGKTTKPLDPTQRAEPKPVESFEERMRKADPAQRKYMLSKGGAIDEGEELAKDVQVARRLEKEELKQYDTKSQRTPRRSSAGGGGMNPADVEKVPGKRLFKMAKGGFVRAADGIAKRGKTKGRML